MAHNSSGRLDSIRLYFGSVRFDRPIVPMVETKARFCIQLNWMRPTVDGWNWIVSSEVIHCRAIFFTKTAHRAKAEAHLAAALLCVCVCVSAAGHQMSATKMRNTKCTNNNNKSNNKAEKSYTARTHTHLWTWVQHPDALSVDRRP